MPTFSSGLEEAIKNMFGTQLASHISKQISGPGEFFILSEPRAILTLKEENKDVS